jgi:hypothetical protein
MNVIACAYRDWARRVLPTLRKHPRVHQLIHVASNEELTHALKQAENGQRTDLVILCGWSTPPEKELVDYGVPIVSEHPAATDRYSPGSPLQNQILDGVRYTKHRIVKVGFPELAPRQWSHEVDMDLTGNMDDILYQMEATSKILFNKFLDEYPSVEWKEWAAIPVEQQIPRRVPEQSVVRRAEFASLTTRQDPYPNAYVEDDYGRLYFEKVRFKAKE